MSLSDKIEIKYFLIALCIGLFLTYTFTTPPKIIYKYPTPDTIDELVYMDHANHCFKYKANQVKCPSNKNQIYSIPKQKLQESFVLPNNDYSNHTMKR